MKKEDSNNKAYTSAGKILLENDESFSKKYIDSGGLADLISFLSFLFIHYSDKSIASIENKMNSAILDRKIDKPIFIIGNARSGTTFLEKVIADHPKAGVIPYHSYLSPLSIKFTNWWFKTMLRIGLAKNVSKAGPHSGGMLIGPYDPCEAETLWRYCKISPFAKKSELDILDSNFDDPVFEKQFKNVINKCLYTQNKVRFLHRNPMNAYRIGFLAKMFPDAKFVRIIRHPYMVVQSQSDLHAVNERLIKKNKFYKKLMNLIFSSGTLSSTKPGHHLRTPKMDQIIEEAKTDFNLSAATLCLEYEQIVDDMVRINNLESRFYQLRYEEFTNNFSEEAKKIFQFIELYDDSTPQLIETQEKKLLNKERSFVLPPLDEHIKDLLRPLVQKNNYSEKELPCPPLRE